MTPTNGKAVAASGAVVGVAEDAAAAARGAGVKVPKALLSGAADNRQVSTWLLLLLIGLLSLLLCR